MPHSVQEIKEGIGAQVRMATWIQQVATYKSTLPGPNLSEWSISERTVPAKRRASNFSSAKFVNIELTDFESVNYKDRTCSFFSCLFWPDRSFV